ncbi:MAG TPA: DUF3015 family protein [Kiritimatiellia bacterium]|nr:DUF3015 family protein [Kiritimatiellia bacterium]HMP95593.1 DUF3015 family protein [Kiritimatiellia bacterium]
MKKFVYILSAMLVGSVVSAATIRDNCGCGIGTMALGNNEATVVSQLAATFLNGICGNQTFGITSGTLDCAPPTAFASNQRVKDFVRENMDQLAMDIAIGEGETLNALADLLEVPAKDRSDLYAKMQKEFDAIFTSHDLSSETLVKNLDKVVNG